MHIDKISEQNSVNFCAEYTKGTIKLLKRSIPEMVSRGEFESSKKALENLIEARKRNDNIMIKICDICYRGLEDLQYSVKLADSKSNTFVSINTPIKLLNRTPAEEFLFDTEYINSDRFVQQAKRNIERNYNKTFLEMLLDLKTNICDFFDAAFSVDIIDSNLPEKKQFAFITYIKEYIFNVFKKARHSKHFVNKKNKAQVNIISKLIDKLK